MASNAQTVATGWELVGKGDWDTLVQDYVEDMIFIMPGQNDVLEGRDAFRQALDNIGAALPPGFDITALRNVGDGDDVISLVNWKSDKVPDGSQLAVLFRFKGDKIYEERWFIDTEQWKAAF